MFDYLGQPGAELTTREGLKGSKIDYHYARLVKGADKVLPAAEVHARLSADAGINLGEEGCGNLHEIHASEERGSSEPGHVTDDPAAESYQNAAPVEPLVEQLFVYPAYGAESLVFLASRNYDHFGRYAGFLQAAGQSFGV
jgi:hypothetical protein